MTFTAIIEIPKFSTYKYEHNKETNTLELDRVLPVECPHNYGFLNDPSIPLSADGDPLDVFIVSEKPIIPLSQVKIKPLGILYCEDNGIEDNKVIAKIEGDFYLDSDYFSDIKFYLENYKKGFIIKSYKVINDPIIFENIVLNRN